MCKYVITFKDDLLLEHLRRPVGGGLLALFHAPHAISSIRESDGERIGVGCKIGEVLQLRAYWIV